MNEKMKNFFEKNQLFAILFSISFVFLFVFIWWMHRINELCDHVNSSIENKINLYSPWGDSFAPFNVIISFLSVIGLIVTIYIQMKGNREQSKSSKEQWILSYKQNFDNNFYNFISSLDKMKEGIHPTYNVLLDINTNIYEKFFLNKVSSHVRKEDLCSVKDSFFSYRNPVSGKTFVYDTNIIFSENIFLQMKKIYNNDLFNDTEKKTYMNVLFSNLDRELMLMIGVYAIKKEDLCIQEILGKFDSVVNLLLSSENHDMIGYIMEFYYKKR